MARTGLTLGKFAPLHRGHQYLIEKALQENDDVVVLIYDCPDVTDVPLNVRAGWLRKMYPSVEVIEAWDGPLEVGNTPELRETHEKYILNILGSRKITSFYSSEFYGEHVSRALGAVDRRLDEGRKRFTISGTMIREDPYRYREFIHPLVYRDLITNVVFLGAPSTGKTTISKRMADEFQTVWMPEYGRTYWEENHVERRLTLKQLVEIADGHIARENELMYEANRYIFTDTNAIITYLFSLYYHGKADKHLVELALASSLRYDVVFVCDTDIPYEDTWDRSGEANRQVFQKQVVSELVTRKIPYFTLRGNINDRVMRVRTVLQSIKKYGNPYDNCSEIKN